MATPIKQDQPDVKERQTAMAEVVKLIKPLDETLGPFRGLFFARQKIGKTTLGASSGLNTLIVSIDPAGTEVLAGRGHKDITVFPLTRWEQTEGLFWFLATQDHPHEMVVIDTATMWTNLCLRYVMGQEHRLDPLMPTMDHQQKRAQIFNNEILRWVNLPINVVFTAQERTVQVRDDDGNKTGENQIVADLNPSSLGVLQGAVGTIGHLYADPDHTEVMPDGSKVKQRRMHLRDNPRYAVGTRVRGLPAIMANPTLAAIMDIRAKTGELPPEDLDLFAATAVDEDEEDTAEEGGMVLETI
jgi:hypothetical protein